MKVLDFGLAKRDATRQARGQRRRHRIADDHLARHDDRRGRDPRHRGLHGAGAGEGTRRRTSAATSGRSACVLYEMLTGKRPFDGEDVSDTLANVLKIDPDWSALPSEIPPAIRTLLQSCLTKDRRRRVADISTALFVLEKGASLAPPAGTVSASAAATQTAVAARRGTDGRCAGGRASSRRTRRGSPRVRRRLVSRVCRSRRQARTR